MSEKEHGATRDTTEAAVWSRKAMKTGTSRAAERLGNACRDSHPSTMYIAKARRLDKKAVELGSTTAAERCNVDLPVGAPLCTAKQPEQRPCIGYPDVISASKRSSPQTPAGWTQSREMDSTRVPNEKTIDNNSQTVRSSNQCSLQRSKGGEILTHDLTQAIASMFDEKPLISCKDSYQHFRIARPNCLPILPDRLGMKIWNFRWFSKTLNQIRKHEQVVCLTRTACRLRKRSCAGCQNMITVDESRFLMDGRRDSICVGQLMQSRKESVGNRHRTMSVHGIHSLVNVPKRRSYHSAFLCHTIILSLAGEICSHSGCKFLKGDDIRRDNARTQNFVRSIECVRKMKDKQKPRPT
jgi:hypothetical protein